MSALSDIRDGMKTVLEAAISGLHVYTYEPDNPLEYPAFVIEPTPDLDYNLTLSGNSLEIIIEGTLYVRVVSNSEGWKELDEYRAPAGSKSIKAAINSDRTLNGTADDTSVEYSNQVTRNRNVDEAYWEFSCRFGIQVLKTVV